MTDKQREKFFQVYIAFWSKLGSSIGILVGYFLGLVVAVVGAGFLLMASIYIPMRVGGQCGLSPAVCSFCLWRCLS